MFLRQFAGRHGQQALRPEIARKLAQSQRLEAAGGVDQDVAVFLEAVEHVDLVQQRGVLDDQRVGLHDGLAQPDFLVVEPAERHHRCAGSFRAEAREGLRVPATQKCRDRQHLRACDHPLSPASVNAYLKHPGLS